MGIRNIAIYIVLLTLSGCSSQPHVVKHAEFVGGENKIYIVSHDWHTGFVIPSEEIFKKIPELGSRFGDIKQIEIGWGDKGFYQAQEITSGLTVKAIFWPTESVIHAVGIPINVRNYFASSKVEEICLSDSELSSLVSFISGSFNRNENGEIKKLKKGIYGNSQFYKGNGGYHLMNTCNQWTAKGIESTGIDINPMFKLTAGSIVNFVADGRFCPNTVKNLPLK